MNCYNLTAAIFLNNVGINLLEANELEGAMSIMNDAVDILHEHDVVSSDDNRIIRGDRISLQLPRLRNPTIFRDGSFLNVLSEKHSNPIAIMVTNDSQDNEEVDQLCTSIIFYNQALALISACQQQDHDQHQERNEMFANVAIDFLKTAVRQSVGNLESTSSSSKALFSTMALRQLIEIQMSLGQHEEVQEYVRLFNYMKSRATAANNDNNARRNHNKLVIEVDSTAAAA
mmetsp:Transcript_5661/g.8041  ORF Transcript_5661/g.8041 Transcript_5661/m.8041 type:complete len:230 (+) Transcript_5661:107-796(+)